MTLLSRRVVAAVPACLQASPLYAFRIYPRIRTRQASTASRPRRAPSYSSHHARRVQEMERHIDSLIQNPQPQQPPLSPPYLNPTSTTPSSSSSSSPASPTSTSPSPSPDPTTPSPTTPSSPNQSTLEKAALVFGSRLSGASTRSAELLANSTIIAGVRVPPKPDEPDNCCMSGCVNCVWDRFRDELEEWAEKRGEADRALAAQKAGEGKAGGEGEKEVEMGGSMDDDGGGSEGLWTLDEAIKSRGAASPDKAKGEKNEQDLFEGIPIGIRAFMELERKMKAKRIARGEDAVTGIDMETKAKWLER